MLKVNLKKARARVKAKFWGEGSVVRETVQVSCTAMETTLEIDSDDDPAKIAKLARLSEAGCYVIQSLKNPTPVSYQVVLNGSPFDPNSG